MEHSLSLQGPGELVTRRGEGMQMSSNLTIVLDKSAVKPKVPEVLELDPVCKHWPIHNDNALLIHLELPW